jgi:cell division septation protein DedD
MDTALKQRLIGAVVLVALAVIFLPMLIKGPAPDSGVSDVPLDVPQAPDGQYETRELPLVTPGNVPNSGAVGLESTAPAGANGVPANPAASSATPAPSGQMLPAADAAGNFAVSFGAYASTADADAVIARLKQAQLPGYREPATINGKTAYRVRIGPYADQATAESVRLRAVQVRDDVKAQVVVLDATATPAATSTASVPLPAAAAPAVTTQALPPEPAKPAPASLPPAAKPPATAPPATAATETKPAATKPVETKPAAKPVASATASTPAASNVGFAVQLGAFASAADANALRDKVRAGGFSAFVEQVRTDKGALNRVRVGPVASRADAEKLKSQVAAKFGINGMVRPHP